MKKTLTAVTFSWAVAISGTAFGGLSVDAPVTIETNYGDLGYTRVGGNMFSARAAMNEVEYIGCQIQADTAEITGTGESAIKGRCDASDSSGRKVRCSTTDPILIDAIASMTPYSYIVFFIPDAADPTNEEGECLRINVSTRSFFIPLVETDKDKLK